MQILKAFTLLAVVGVSGIAHADDLDAALSDEQRSLSGEVLNDVARDVRASRNQSAPARMEAVRRGLEKRGLVRDQVGGKRWTWKESAQPEQDRVVLHRVLAEGQAEPSSEERLTALRERKTHLSREQLIERAAKVVATLDETKPADATETLVPVRTGGTAFGFSTPTGTSSYLVRQRVTLRRHIGSTPVLGRQAEVDVEFDPEGNLEQLSVPSSSYKQLPDGLPEQRVRGAGKAVLARSFTKAGFDHAPKARGEKLKRSGKPGSTKEIGCGYYDDGKSESLARGCLITIVGDGSAEQVFVPAEF